MELKDTILIKGKMRIYLNDKDTAELVYDTGWIDNLIPIAGRFSLAANLAGSNILSNPGQVTFCAVGDGASPPVVSGTILSNEFERIVILSSSTNDTITSIIRAFFSPTEGNGTITEAGLFGEDATGVINTGTLFQWVSLSVTKTSLETMTILSKIPFNFI